MAASADRYARLALSGACLGALVVMLAKAGLALVSAHDLNHVSGVWLALAADAHAGLFYRAIAEGGEYGGTRYFPLLFLLIAGGMQLGLPAVAAGQAVGVLTGVLLAGGAFVFLRRLGTPRPLAVAGAILALAPYFVQQTLLAIRADALAAALALWGSAAVAARLGPGEARRWMLWATVAFTLAVAAKPTAGYAAVAGVLALAFAGRPRDAWLLLAACAGGWTVLLSVIWIGSEGRAPEAFAALALGGADPGALGPSLLLWPLRLLLSSYYVTAVVAFLAFALATRPRDLLRLPALLVAGAALAAAAALATPGTIATNQFVEPYVTAAVCIAWLSHVRFRFAGLLVVALLLAWAVSHEARQLAALHRDGAVAATRASRAAVVQAMRDCGEPILSESPLVPILAGRRPLLLDPFAFRVATLGQPGLTDELARRIASREFECIFLEYDPGDARGRGWYRNVSLGETVVDAVLGAYRYEGNAGGQRVYRRETRRH
jgi:hypothetical protein